jgi:hypothetical protein
VKILNFSCFHVHKPFTHHYGELIEAALLTLAKISVEDTPDAEMLFCYAQQVTPHHHKTKQKGH